MQMEQDTIPLNVDQTPDWKNRFPGVITYVETFDTDDDDAEPADVLSFESLRKAFATIQSVETELAQTIPEIESSAEHAPEPIEQAEYEIDGASDLEYGSDLPLSKIEPPIAVGTRLETIVEAMLFVGNRENRPLEAEQIAEKLRNVSAEEVDQTVVHLNAHYQERGCPYTIAAERGGYQMVLRSEFASVRTNFYGKIRETRLSQQAIDTLAVVAYRQPITVEEIQDIRQQSCSTILNQLVRRNLLSISREIQDKKSVVRYHTTPRFLELFQIQSLDDIPKPEEISETLK
jgi:segregation and condensation protein B